MDVRIRAVRDCRGRLAENRSPSLAKSFPEVRDHRRSLPPETTGPLRRSAYPAGLRRRGDGPGPPQELQAQSR